MQNQKIFSHSFPLLLTESINIENLTFLSIEQSKIINMLEFQKVSRRSDFRVNSNVFFLNALTFCRFCNVKRNRQRTILLRNFFFNFMYLILLHFPLYTRCK